MSPPVRTSLCPASIKKNNELYKWEKTGKSTLIHVKAFLENSVATLIMKPALNKQRTKITIAHLNADKRA